MPQTLENFWRKSRLAIFLHNIYATNWMAIMIEITGLEHLNCIEIGEVPKLLAIPVELPVIYTSNFFEGKI